MSALGHGDGSGGALSIVNNSWQQTTRAGIWVAVCIVVGLVVFTLPGWLTFVRGHEWFREVAVGDGAADPLTGIAVGVADYVTIPESDWGDLPYTDVGTRWVRLTVTLDGAGVTGGVDDCGDLVTSLRLVAAPDVTWTSDDDPPWAEVCDVVVAGGRAEYSPAYMLPEAWADRVRGVALPMRIDFARTPLLLLG
jgi:hypothetical protein